MPDDKPFALLIGERLKKKKASPADEPVDHEKDLGLDDGSQKEDMQKSAAADLLDSIKSDDVGGVVAALKDLMKLCEGDEEEQESEPEPE